MSMGFMIAAASRNRDNRGRYSEDGNDRRMERNYDNRSDGNYGNYSRMDDDNEMRRRRDSRGRYMEDEGSRMEYPEGNYSRMENEPEMRRRRDSRGRYMEGETSARYMLWPEHHIPPYLDDAESNIRPGTERRGYEDQNGMRDRNIVNIRDYQDKRKIGFAAAHMHGDNAKHEEMRHGSAYPMAEELTMESAEEWVESMKNTDPEHPTGAKWSMETIKPIAMKHGFNTPEKQMEYWAVMNMMYSDYCETAKKHGVSTMDFYGDMAKAWMKDKDAVENKTAAYIEYCTK